MMEFLKSYMMLITLTVTVIVAGASLMTVSQNVYDIQRNVNNLDRDILSKQWEIRALNAELAYLSRPDRLEQISSAMTAQMPQTASSASDDEGLVITPAAFSAFPPAGTIGVVPVQKPSYRTVSIKQPSVVSASPSRTDQAVADAKPVTVAAKPLVKTAKHTEPTTPKPTKSFSALLSDLEGAE